MDWIAVLVGGLWGLALGATLPLIVLIHSDPADARKPPRAARWTLALAALVALVPFGTFVVGIWQARR